MSNHRSSQDLPQNTDRSKKESLRILGLAIALRDNDERMDEPLADFSEGFARGWGMAVGKCFRDALDLKQTDKIVGGTKIRVWTQGSTFSFSQGDTIYDTPQAYQLWGKALQSIKAAYQVVAATASRPKKELITFKKNASFTGSLKGSRSKANVTRRKNVMKAIPSNWVELEKINTAVNKATGSGVSSNLLQEFCDFGALERRVETIGSRFPGAVRFRVLVPNADRSKLYAAEEKSMSQDDFVALLITGGDLHK